MPRPRNTGALLLKWIIYYWWVFLLFIYFFHFFVFVSSFSPLLLGSLIFASFCRARVRLISETFFLKFALLTRVHYIIRPVLLYIQSSPCRLRSRISFIVWWDKRWKLSSPTIEECTCLHRVGKNLALSKR